VQCNYLHPGQIAFTRMRWGAQSKAAALVKPSTACFDAQYATVLESVSGAGTLKRCLSKTTCSTISRSRRLTVNARKVYYPASVAVWQRILSHHLSSGSAATVHDSRGIHTHGGGPDIIWHRPDGLWILDLGRYAGSVHDTVHSLSIWPTPCLNDTVTHMSSLPYASTAWAIRALVLEASHTSV
jgi:hypothetical protein